MHIIKKIGLAIGLMSMTLCAHAKDIVKCPPTSFISETVAPLLDTIIDHGPAIVFGKKEMAVYETDKPTGWILIGLYQPAKTNPPIADAFKHAVDIVSHVDKLDNEYPTTEVHMCIYFSSYDPSAWMYLEPQEYYHIDKNLTSHMRK